MAGSTLVRLSADFLLTKKQHDKLNTKYAIIFDEDGIEVTSGQLYLIGYEDEHGEECKEDGESL